MNLIRLIDIIVPIDKTKVIPPVDDKYLTWPGKDQGKPKPPIIWLDDQTTQALPSH